MLLRRLLFVLCLAFLPAAALGANCLQPLIDNGRAFSDPSAGMILVGKVVPPAIVFGVAHRGIFFGCTAEEQKLSKLIGNGTPATRVNVFLQFKHLDINGVEATLSAGKRILFARTLSVPWDLVDRRNGVTLRCTPSNEARFESFMNSELLNNNGRRCSLIEIQEITGRAKSS